jgi:2-hydroxychromene-2-carboxylate isomerase
MTPVTFWFDPVSPYAYLAFERMPQVFAGCSYAVSYRPVLLAGLLHHWGQLGPAEIAPKRDWTCRQVAWLARREGIALQMPAAHPFNPLPLLRLLVACGEDGTANRYQCEAVLHQLWRSGAAGADAQALARLTAQLAPPRDPRSDAVKQALRANTDAAIALGVFGVPTLELPRHAPGPGPLLFWGVDALDMAAARLRGEPWFDAEWDRVAAVAPGVQRPR